jgi:lipoate-protein ligase A
VSFADGAHATHAAAAPPRFTLSAFAGPARAFHALELLDRARPEVVTVAPDGDALVLGSSQSTGLVDADACARSRVEVVQRRSGGGAVLVEVGAMCWFDVVVPTDHPHFAAFAGDVSASMVWMGEHVAAALSTLGVGDLRVHSAPMVGTAWSRLVCFAGIGGGEVLTATGAKLVGISQRRRRGGARFQCMVHVEWNPHRLLELLAPPRPTAAELPPVETVPRNVADALPAAVVAALA